MGLWLSGTSLINSQVFTSPHTSPAHQTACKLQELQISPVTVASDFLKSVLELTKASMEIAYGSKLVRDSKVEYILTIPAIWSDSAKALMVKAAENAGFGSHRVDFNLISEPECAAAYTLKSTEPNNLKARVLYCFNHITVTDLY